MALTLLGSEITKSGRVRRRRQAIVIEFNVRSVNPFKNFNFKAVYFRVSSKTWRAVARRRWWRLERLGEGRGNEESRHVRFRRISGADLGR
jgi:hypothetical protein